ncbi:MAG TPA: class I SAM-dependent methyltransferase [Burkholderiales bacterium]|nr:class I SAM-dependent methyltransferase [Burkholderiales bacterium]
MRADRPSSTAALIAAATALLARDRRFAHLVPAGAAEICERCLSPFWLTAARLRWLAWAAERATIPGLMLHFILRKRWIEEAVRGALARGSRQVVVLGAGYDTLAARLAPQFPAVQFVEIDQPATQAVKCAAVERRNLRFIAADLACAPLAQVLPPSAERSVFVLEGLLMYLTPAEQDTLFAAIRSSEVVFTAMEPRPDGRIAFHNATWLERVLLALWKEPFKSAVPRDALPGTLRGWGLTLRDMADLAAAHPELALARGEIVVHAERRA